MKTKEPNRPISLFDLNILYKFHVEAGIEP
jgi:hypothetical protein